MLRHNRTVVDLAAIRHNYRILADSLPEGVGVMPVVKANAYGHGIIEIAQTVLKEGAVCFAVALVEEGMLLRGSGIQGEILVLGAAMERAAEEAILHELSQTVFEPDMVAWLDETAARLGKTAKVHVKIDTGMARIGLRGAQEAQAMNEALEKAEHVQLCGIYTHFADGDNPDEKGHMNAFTRQQLDEFIRLRRFFPEGVITHAANSAMSLVAPEAAFQMVREGISLYGYPPVKTGLSFQPALSWESEIVHIKEVPAGTTISYGRTYTAGRPLKVATVAVGYGDGYHRAMSNRAEMLVGGKRAKVLGRICMDQTMIDVTDISGVQVGDPVVLIGSQGQEQITAEDLAEWADTISYEVLLAITARVPRTYAN